jgi:outer membrane protein assembly factor BamB
MEQFSSLSDMRRSTLAGVMPMTSRFLRACCLNAAAIASAVAVLSAPAMAGEADNFAARRPYNWHQWRGPDATGVAPHAEPPLHWDAQTNIKWKAELPGEGSATPIVWENKVFVVAAEKTDRVAENPPQPAPDARTVPPSNYYRFLVMCFDRETGKLIWERVATEEVPQEGQHLTNTYASSSPVTDGRRLFVSFGSRGIFCYDLDGNLKWERDLGQMRTRRGWGEGVSPALHGETLIVNWDHEDPSFIVAMDAETGKTRWQADRDEPTSWATPLVVEHNGRKQVIVNGTKRVRSYDLDTGEVLWECGGQTVNAIPSPVATNDMAIVMSGYQGANAVAIPLDAKGDITDSDTVRWSHRRNTPYVPSPLLLGDRLYFTSSNNGILSSLDISTGKVIYGPVRIPGVSNLYSSPVAAGGRIYITGRDGTTTVLKPGDKFEVLATNVLNDPIDASPVAVGKQLFLRSNRYLYCIEEQK